MIERFQLQHLQKLKKQQSSPFKKRIILQKKIKFMNPQPVDQHANISISNFDPKSQLKAKILKAILTNNQTIQRQIQYRKAFSNCITPKHDPKQRRNYRLNLSYQQKSRNNTHSKKKEQVTSSDSLRYNGLLEMQMIMKKINISNNDFHHHQFEIRQRSISEPQIKQKHLTTRIRSSTGHNHRRKRKYQIHSQRKDKQYEDIKPWNEQIHQKQFQYF